jgi:hypothetical protein
LVVTLFWTNLAPTEFGMMLTDRIRV